MQLDITIILIIITSLVSIGGFSNQKIIDDLIFYPPAIYRRNQWYRFFTCGFIHADWMHLAFNMFAFYSFGNYIEDSFTQLFGQSGKLLYIILYVSSLFFCLLPTYIKHRDDAYYRSLGASGAVSAVVFAGILLFPDFKIGLLFIPPIIPGFVFGPVYLIVTAYLDKKGRGCINHSAHLWGALYGITFAIVMSKILSDFNPIENFLSRIADSF